MDKGNIVESGSFLQKLSGISPDIIGASLARANDRAWRNNRKREIICMIGSVSCMIGSVNVSIPSRR